MVARHETRIQELIGRKAQGASGSRITSLVTLVARAFSQEREGVFCVLQRGLSRAVRASIVVGRSDDSRGMMGVQR